MNYNQDKVDEIILALLYLTTFKVESGFRAWKSLDWKTMEQLYERGLVGDPKSKTKSVTLTEEGRQLSKELFEKHFGIQE